MKDKATANSRGTREVPGGHGMRTGMKWAVTGILAVSCGAMVWHFLGQKPIPGQTTTSIDPNDPGTVAIETVPGPVGNTAAHVPAISPETTKSALSSPASVVLAAVPVDPALAALVSNLKNLSGTNNLTPEATAAWTSNFTQLVQSGSSAVPALGAFLSEKNDTPFSRDAWQATGYNSARVAAIDALRQIGGPEAIAAMEGLLGTSQNPRDVALLARNLEEAQPGQYREKALAAARAGLQAVAPAQNSQTDVAPFFEVFQHYGDASVVPDLERAMDQWKYYATIALADLPDGAGVPSILRLAEGSSGNRVVALEMVAQLAPNNSSVKDFLLAQVSANRIPPNLWPYLTGPLAGDQYFPVDSAITQYPQVQSWSDIKTTRINSGNQNLYVLPGYLGLTAEELAARASLVDELSKLTSDPAGVQALQRARETLARRSTQASVISQPATSLGK